MHLTRYYAQWDYYCCEFCSTRQHLWIYNVHSSESRQQLRFALLYLSNFVHTPLHIHMHITGRTNTYIFTCTLQGAHTPLHIHMHIKGRTHTLTYSHAHYRAHTHPYIFTCTLQGAHTPLHIYMHITGHTHTLTYSHAH